MDGSAFNNMNFGPLIWFAVIGMIATVLVGIGGLAAGIWWLVNHVQFV